MAHASKIVTCAGPDDAHALDNIPLQPRHGALDAVCAACRGHGSWNREIDLISFRCKRVPCETCHGSGWIETGDDPVTGLDIQMTPQGYPKWGTRTISGVPERK